MAIETVNTYSVPEVDERLADKADVGHTHSLADVGITEWTTWTPSAWSTSGGTHSRLGGSGEFTLARWMRIGKTFFYQIEYTFGVNLPEESGAYLCFGFPYRWRETNQHGTASVKKTDGGSIDSFLAATQGFSMSGQSPDHYLVLIRRDETASQGFYYTTAGWSAGDVITATGFAELA